MKRKNVILLIILFLIVMLISGTFSYFQLVFSADEDSTYFYTNTLDVLYSNPDGSVIYNQKFYPRSEPSLDDLEYAYSNTFVVTNTGGLDGIVDIDLSITECSFMKNSVGYALYNDDNKISYGFINPDGNTSLLNNIFLESQDSVTYTLLLWLNDSGKQQNSNANKNLIASIVVNERQNISK